MLQEFPLIFKLLAVESFSQSLHFLQHHCIGLLPAAQPPTYSEVCPPCEEVLQVVPGSEKLLLIGGGSILGASCVLAACWLLNCKRVGRGTRRQGRGNYVQA